MHPDLNRSDQAKPELDDDQLGALVRDVAGDWRMPPQRLDQPTWRDRTRNGPRHRRPWPVRLAGPATAAVAATVILAVAAVWLTAPRGNHATVGQTPSASPTSGASSGPASTPLPKLVLNGELPSVTRLMVRADGQYRIADLATGELGAESLGPYSGPTALVPRPGGGWLCICAKFTAFALHGATGLSLSLVTLDAEGTVVDRVEVRQVEGMADPDVPAGLQFQLVDGGVGVAPDGRTAFFTWMQRNGAAGWSAGVDVVDVESGTITDGRELTVDATATTAGGPITRNAPNVSVSPAGDRILLSSFWFVEDPDNPTPDYGLDRWTASIDGQTIGAVESLVPQAEDDCGEFDRGLVNAETAYQVCARASGDLLVRRFALDGALVGETPLRRTEAEFSAGALVARSGDALYVWDPVAAVLSRVDLLSGDVTESPSQAAAAPGPLDAVGAFGRRLGNWIAPSALAKLLLDPGLVVSPDGTRVYAIGVASAAPTGAGSTGVYAFDARSLAPVGHWAPTADFTSIAISADGRFVYASGQGGVDAQGVASRNGTSVTVFDATEGSVRLIAGKLGSTDLWFGQPTVE